MEAIKKIFSHVFSFFPAAQAKTPALTITAAINTTTEHVESERFMNESRDENAQDQVLFAHANNFDQIMEQQHQELAAQISSTYTMLKRFECSNCQVRFSLRSNAMNHIKKIHNLDLTEARRVLRTMSSDEARETFSAYEETRRTSKISPALLTENDKYRMLKPFECSKCKFRCGYWTNTVRHIITKHQLERQEAKTFIRVLSKQDARKTLKDYEMSFPMMKMLDRNKRKMKQAAAAAAAAIALVKSEPKNDAVEPAVKTELVMDDDTKKVLFFNILDRDHVMYTASCAVSNDSNNNDSSSSSNNFPNCSSSFVSKRKRTFHCLLCPYKTTMISCIKTHLPYHRKVTNYKCRYCTYYVARRHNMKQHEVVHPEYMPPL